MNTDRPRRKIDRTGRSQYVRKSTRPEMDRRDAWAIKLWNRGHTINEIAEALDVGGEVVRQTIRVVDPASSHSRRMKGCGPVTEPCPWRDEDVPVHERERVIPTGVQESRWRQSRIIGMAQMLNDEYRESNFANILANQATDAEDADDRDWLIEAAATINAAIEKLERARRILNDDHYRVACRDTLEGVEQLRRKPPSLRAVPPLIG